MDDPLSAVDPHVALALFEDLVEHHLAGATRVLVTHQLQLLNRADNVVVVDGLAVAFQGSYEELLLSPAWRLLRDSSDDTDDADNASPSSVGSDGGASRRAAWPLVVPPPKAVTKAGTTLMTNENQEVGSVSGAVYGWYLTACGRGNAAAVVATIIIWRLLTALCDLVYAYWVGGVPIAGYAFSAQDYIILIAVLLVAGIVMSLLRQIPFVRAVISASGSAHYQMIDNLLSAPVSFYDTTPTGRILNRCSKDVEVMDVMIPEILNFFLSLCAIIVGTWVVMCLGAPYVAPGLLGVAAAFVLLYRFFIRTHRSLKRLESIARSPLAAVMNESLGGLPTIRAYGAAAMYRQRHSAALADADRTMHSRRCMQRWFGIRIDGLSTSIVFMTCLVIVLMATNMSRDELDGAIPFFGISLAYAMAISGATSFFTQMLSEIVSMFSSVERIKEFVDGIPQERVVVYGSGQPDDSRPPVPAASWPAAGRVEFRDVQLRYRDGLPLVLKGVSFAVGGGEKVGVVGRTGSGKSTLMLALFRMVELATREEHDDSAAPDDTFGGSILIDGVDIATVAQRDLRSRITMIPQDPVLFVGTVRSNLDPFVGHDDDELWAVLEHVNMAERVRGEAEGLLAAVAERGANFSAGERQLLCLARAILKRCQILLLDEATASIDTAQDALVQAVIREQFSGCTVLTIAHRLATIIDSDKVLVLDAGQVREFAAPADLLRDDTTAFAGMVAQLGPAQYAELAAAADAARSLATRVTEVVPRC
jgi:ATP-binding cassette subfamily C (CFTR/MRP) protein 5